MASKHQAAIVPSCQEDEIYLDAIGKCRNCSLVCHEGLPDEKCPSKCLLYLYKTLKKMLTTTPKEKLVQGAVDTSDTSWLFTNWCYVFISMIAVGIAGFIIWKNWDKIIQLIKRRGYRNVPREDPTAVVIEPGMPGLDFPEPGPNAPESEESLTSDLQPPSAPQQAGREDRATQTDTFSVEETGYLDETGRDTEDKSPVPSTSPGKIMEEVDHEDDKSKIALSDLDHLDQDDLEHEEEEEENDNQFTEIKRPTPDGAACASLDTAIELKQMRNDDDPKVTYNDEGLDEQLEAVVGEDHRLLETKGMTEMTDRDDRDEEI